jgi:hypothetical protein
LTILLGKIPILNIKLKKNYDSINLIIASSHVLRNVDSIR